MACPDCKKNLTSVPVSGTLKEGGEGRRPEPRKTRRPEGPSALALRDLILLLLTFARDLESETPAKEAGIDLGANLELMYERLHTRG